MINIVLIGNFPPRKCGIATFTHDLYEGLKKSGIKASIIAMNDGLIKYDYPSNVVFEIEQNDLASYIEASNFITTNSFDAVILQHEFGIFGGTDGSHIIQLLKRLRIPVITTLHTILDTPTDGQKHVIEKIASYSKKIISISQKGIDILTHVYEISSSQCLHIHHGVHKIAIQDTAALKEKNGIADKKVLLTFGLLSRNKSIEVVIEALPKIIRGHPEVVYIVLGATHPHVLKQDGEEYRHYLMRLVKKLHLEKNVIFINRFVSNEELFAYLKMCDIYVIPYLGEKQISSGTLIYTMGAQKAILSTPFWYAQEMLADNRGVLFDFNNTEQVSEKILDLLNNPAKREAIAHNAFSLAKNCYWPIIGKQYFSVIKELTEKTKKKTPQYITDEEGEPHFLLPQLNLQQLRVLTDYTGILQHARYNIPDRTHGYCVDDNARALMLSVMLQNEVQDVDEVHRLTSIYLSFIDYSYNDKNNQFRNFMNYERQWLEEKGSEDSFGRTMWTLGYTSAYTNSSNFYNYASDLFKKGLFHANLLKHPRSLAYLMLGLVYHAQVHNEESIVNLLKNKTKELLSFFEKTSSREWPWFDHIVTYSNSRIPQALIASGMYLHDEDVISKGLTILDWLIDTQFENDIFIPVGNDGWFTQEKKALYDQQPIEAHGMIDACLQAEKYCKNGQYAEYAMKAFSWFMGDNSCGLPVYDFATGGCRDGLNPMGPNLNQGAESTLSWLMSLMSVSVYLRNKGK